ncbi:MAG: methyltransferase domain-containing protein [Candidatus Binatia bacterium]
MSLSAERNVHLTPAWEFGPIATIPLLSPAQLDPRAAEEVRAALRPLVACGVVDPALRSFAPQVNRRYWRTALDAIRGYRHRWRLLDVSCGVGAFAHAAALDGWEAAGCDASAAATTYGATNLGVDLRAATDGRLPFPDEEFDVVTLHAGFPGTDVAADGLAEVVRVLRPVGALYLVVENAMAAARCAAGAPDAADAHTAGEVLVRLQAVGLHPVRLDYGGASAATVVAGLPPGDPARVAFARASDVSTDLSIHAATITVLAERRREAA